MATGSLSVIVEGILYEILTYFVADWDAAAVDEMTSSNAETPLISHIVFSFISPLLLQWNPVRQNPMPEKVIFPTVKRKRTASKSRPFCDRKILRSGD